jgi:DNA-binding transcriptional regulator YhcF (GntR family)
MDFKKQKGIYEQIAEKILFDILQEILKEGERIASVRDLAQDLQVNPNTVMRAYTYLNDEGIIENQRGVGYFIAEGAKEKARKILIDEFFENQLPAVTAVIHILGISMDEIITKMKE